MEITVGNDTSRRVRFDRAGWLILAGLTTLAVAMRFYRLGTVPDGLQYDEAFNGLDALALLDIPLTDWPVFFNGNYGREPLFIWLSGGVHALFGPSIWTARFISALSGVLLIPALAWLGWEIAPLLGVRNRQLFALWCSAATLALLWSQIFARYGIRAALFALVEILLWAALWRAWQREPPALGLWTIAGLLAGLSFYTYLPARLLPLVLLPLVVAAFFQNQQRLRGHLPGLLGGTLGGTLGCLVVAAPLGLYFLQTPIAFSTRIEQVGILGRESVFANLTDTLGMFIWSGDHNPRHNLPLRPVLDPLLVLPFLIGLGRALRRFWRLGRMFLLAGLGVLLLPTVLSDYTPNFQRAIGALPFTASLIAYGTEGIVRFVGQFWRKMLRPVQALVWAVFAAAIALTIWTYFGVWAPSPEMFHIWGVGYNQLARHIGNESEATVYISPRSVNHRHPAADYLLTIEGATAQYHDEQFCMRVALTAPARYIFLVNGGLRSHLPIDSYYPDSTPPLPVIFDQMGKPWATELKKARDAPVIFPEMRPQNVELADGISLNGYWLSQERIHPGQSLYMRLFWRVNRTPTADYTTFIHLAHVDGNGSPERLVSFDRPPGNGVCPTTEWLPGEMVVDEVELNMPAALPAGNLFLTVGFYTLADGRRMPVSDTDTGQILIGPLSR